MRILEIHINPDTNVNEILHRCISLIIKNKYDKIIFVFSGIKFILERLEYIGKGIMNKDNSIKVRGFDINEL